MISNSLELVESHVCKIVALSKKTIRPLLHKLKIQDRRECLGLARNESLSKNQVDKLFAITFKPFAVAKTPIAVVQSVVIDGTSVNIPLKQEESSVVVGTDVMLRKFLNTLEFTQIGDNLTVEQDIPANLFSKEDMDGVTMAKGIEDIHDFGVRDWMRFLTDYKGKLNTVSAFLMAIAPSDNIRLCDDLMKQSRFKGRSYPARTQQFGPLDRWTHSDKKSVLSVKMTIPLMIIKDFSRDATNPIVQQARSIISEEILNDSVQFTKIIMQLYLGAGLAAKRSIFYKGNSAHHVHIQANGENIEETFTPKPNNLTQIDAEHWDPTSEETLDAQVENYLLPAYDAIGKIKVASETVVFAGGYNPKNAQLAETILSAARVQIDTQEPVISGQIVIQKTAQEGSTINNFIRILSDPIFQDKIKRAVLTADSKATATPLTNLQRRLGKLFYDPWQINRIGSSTVVITINMFTGSSQGANRMNAACEGIRDIFNKMEIQSFTAKGGILSNWHSKRGATGELRIPLSTLGDKLELVNKMIELSKNSLNNEPFARELNHAMVEFATYADMVTGQDTRANITSALFQAYEPKPVDGIHGEPTYDPENPSYKPLLLLELESDDLVIKLNGPWASARTAVGRTVNKFGMVKIARDKMSIPIEGDATGKVEQLDRKTAIGVLFAGFEFLLSKST
jgi:hydroxymethylglutaryl-CoA reductase